MKGQVLVDVRNFTRKEAYISLIKKAVIEALRACGKKGVYEVSVALVGNARMRALKKEWKGEDAVTDVLSFPFSDFQKKGNARFKNIREVLGEIVICAPYAYAQAKEMSVSVRENMITLAAHGAIHLCGIDHEISARAHRKTVAIQKKVLKLVLKK